MVTGVVHQVMQIVRQVYTSELLVRTLIYDAGVNLGQRTNTSQRHSKKA